MSYPVDITVQPAVADRNRLTTFFRLLLALPHLLLVGTIGFSVGARGDNRSVSGEGGLLGLAAGLLAIVSWFTLVLTGIHFAGIRQFTAFYLRWRLRAAAYLMLLEDQYPPFGDGDYPAALLLTDPIGPRDRVTVLLRLLLAVPHLIVLVFLLLAWGLATIAAWFAIVFTGRYPPDLYEFSVGVLRWRLRVEAYLLLMVDEYPPFSLK